MNKKILVVKDLFLTQITGKPSYNIRKILPRFKFKKNCFYSYIFDYNPKEIEKCSKLNFNYISSRIVLKYTGNFLSKKNDKKYLCLENNNNAILDNFKNIIEELYKTSRFYKDKKMKKFSKKIYGKWVNNSLFNKYADKTFTTKYGNRVIALVTLKIDKNDCNIDLVGVDRHYQNKGIGSMLISYAIKKLRNYNIYVGTEAENIKALNFYLKNNFKIYQYKLIFHKHT